MRSLDSTAYKVFITFFSRIIVAVSGIVFVPVYIRLIGPESYGLVAFFGTLAGSLAVLDLGLSTAISRQLSILKTATGKKQEMKDLFFSVEVIYWGIALLLGVLIIVSSHAVAEHWINAKNLPPPTISRAVMLMGVVFAVQFPVSIYNGTMIAMDKQVSNAFLTIFFNLVKYIGVLAALKWVSSSVWCYFAWQAVVSFLFTMILRHWSKKDWYAGGYRASFSKLSLTHIKKFAAGMTGISVISFFLSQVDKIMVSKMVLLEYVGYYNIAFVAASIIIQIVSPLQPVLFPRFTSLMAEGKEVELIALYKKACHWIAIIVYPIGLTLAFFSYELLFAWTHNEIVSANTAPLLRIFSIGTTCNCLMWMPYFFMLAKGNTKYTIYQNLICVIVLMPVLYILTLQYGAVGASLGWLIVNAGCAVISIPLFHHIFLKDQLLHWYKLNLIPLFISLALIVSARYVLTTFFGSFHFWNLVAVLLVVAALYVLSVKELRHYVMNLKNKIAV